METKQSISSTSAAPEQVSPTDSSQVTLVFRLECQRLLNGKANTIGYRHHFVRITPEQYEGNSNKKMPPFAAYADWKFRTMLKNVVKENYSECQCCLPEQDKNSEPSEA